MRYPTRAEWISWSAAVRDKEPKPLVYVLSPVSNNNAAACWIGEMP